jgi:hypothetical protein
MTARFPACFQGLQHSLVDVEAFVGDQFFGFESREQHIGSIQLAGGLRLR